jgi:O-antigen/teichoic acid export membrane protein
MSQSFFRGAAYLTLVELVVKARGLIILPLLTKYLGAEQFGIWSQTSVIAATLSPLIVLGTDSAIIRYLPGMSLHQQRRLFTAWLLTILATACGAVILIGSVPDTVAAMFYGKGDFARFVYLAGLMLLVTLALNCLRNWFRIRNETRAFGAVAALQALISLAALALGVYQAVPLEGLILYAVLADLLVALGCAVYIGRQVGLARPDFSLLGKLVRFGLPLVPAGFAMWGLGYMDRLFLVRYGTLQEIGIYSLVYQIGYIAVQFLVNPIWTMYASTASEAHNQGRHEEVQRLFERSVASILVLSLPSLVGLLILGEDVLALLASPEFLPGAPLMALVALGYLCLMLAAYFEVSLGLIHRQHLATASAALAFLVNLVGNILLIPTYTIVGAAVATTLGFATQLAFAMAMATRHGLLRVRLNYPLRVLVAALLMGVPLYLADRWLPLHDLQGFALKLVIGASAFAVSAWLLRLLPPQFTAIFLRHVRRG